MSFQATHWAVRQKTGGPSAKAVLMALANYAGDKGECFPSNKKIANETEQSRATVQRRMVELEALGFIARFKRFRESGAETSMEIVLLHSDEARAYAQARGWSPDIGMEVARRLLHEADPVSECDGAADAQCDTGRSTADTPPVAIVRPLIEPSDEQPDYPPQAAVGGEDEGGGLSFEEISARFIRAWGFDDPTDRKDPALRLLAKCSREEQMAAIRAADRYRSECRVRGRKACHAKTWLFEKGWEGFATIPLASKPQYVFIEVGSQQAAAWTRHHLNKTGKKPLMIEMNAPGGRRAVGRYEPTEWPPSDGQQDLLASVESLATPQQPMEARP